MKIINRLLIIMLILGGIIFIKDFTTLGALSSDKDNYRGNFVVNEKNQYLMLVNKENSLPAKYIPKDMVKPNIKFLSSTSEESKHLDREVAKNLEDLFEGAKNDNITLIGSSAYRSYKSQVGILKDTIKKNGTNYANSYVAKPGQSEHQSGLAIDVTNEVRCMDKTSKEAQWLYNNSHKFGFILRYLEGKEHITGYNYEPWHIRYVGKEAAKDIYENNITLEEYLYKEY